ncbi:hypothetical protein GIX45_17915 [Erwinia sp. CPCC 100877]|nr:hypothetical protein [Erwinia sp. CPCC 100877]
MKKQELLEKLEIYQIDLLAYLVHAGGTATKKELVTYLNISDYFFIKTIDNLKFLAKKSNHRFSIETTKRTITFHTKPDYSLHILYNEFISSAPKYKILKELFWSGTINIARLCKKINISHSTYFRKISELNQLLKEFDLSIQNGCLIGSELQIRFFYVSLYSITDFEEPFDIPHTDPRIHEAVSQLQQALDRPLSTIAKKKLTSYLSILKRRYAQKNISFSTEQNNLFYHETDQQNQKSFLSSLQKTELFKKFNKILKAFLTYYSFKSSNIETVWLILYIIGEDLIPARSYFLAELEQIEKQHTFFIFQMKEEFLFFLKKHYPNADLEKIHNAIFHYYLKSVSYHYLIFKGQIDAQWVSTTKDLEKESDYATIATFIENLKQQYPPELIDALYSDSLIKKYLNALHFYKKWINTKISVGIFIEGDLLEKKNFTNWWINYIKLSHFAHAEPLKPNHSYDLVISNVNQAQLRSKGKFFFFMSDYSAKVDITDLDQLLQEIHASMQHSVSH